MSNQFEPVRPEEIAQLQPYHRNGDKKLELDGLSLVIHKNGNFAVLGDFCVLSVIMDTRDSDRPSIIAKFKLHEEDLVIPSRYFDSGYDEKCLAKLYWDGMWPINEFIAHVVNSFHAIRLDAIEGEWEEQWRIET